MVEMTDDHLRNELTWNLNLFLSSYLQLYIVLQLKRSTDLLFFFKTRLLSCFVWVFFSSLNVDYLKKKKKKKDDY